MILDSTTTDATLLQYTKMHGATLEQLFLPESEHVTDAGLQAAVANCPKLLHLHIDARHGKITDDSVLATAAHCPRLQSFSLLFGFGSITDSSMMVLADNCTQLQRLVLHGCSGITNKGIEAVATKCTKLKTVQLHHCSGIGNGAIQALVEARADTLQSLAIAFCPVTSRAVTTIPTLCQKNLTHFEVRDCVDVSTEAIASAAHAMPQLALIDFTPSWIKLVARTVVAKPVVIEAPRSQEKTSNHRKSKHHKGKHMSGSRAERWREQLAGFSARHPRKSRIAMAIARPVLSPILAL